VTIRRGVDWGEARTVPEATRLITDDGALHQWVVDHRRGGRPIADVALAGGDLAYTVSGGARLGEPATYAPLDVVAVSADGSKDVTWAASHVVARRSWWRGEVLVAMNAEFLGAYDVAPRAHPNDGLVDVIRVDPAMSLRARHQARARARTGSHLPHPRLAVRRGSEMTFGFARPLVVWVDGVRWRSVSELRLAVEPDAYHAYF
jgi:YegS C-terminal NAD kinase beta sandwich-like domain